MEREAQPQRGPRPSRQRPHLAPAGGAELGCLVGASAAGGNRHPKTASPGPDHPATGEDLGPETGSSGPPGRGFHCGLVVIPKTKLRLRKPPGKFITRPLLAPALHITGSGNLTRRLGSLLDPRCPGHFRPQGESESWALDGTGTRETLLPVGVPCGVACSAMVPAAVPWVRQKGRTVHLRRQEGLRAPHLSHSACSRRPLPL